MSKAGKKRFCPAAQQEISSQECGEYRNSRYRCPKDCSFNLFAPANYTQLLDAETRIDKIAYEVLISEPEYARATIQRLEKAGFDTHAVNSAVLNEIFSAERFGPDFRTALGEIRFGRIEK